MPRSVPVSTVCPNRLFAAADVLLRAMDSAHGLDARVPMYAGPLRRGASRSSEVFTSEEFVEAMAMLIRMGMVPRSGSAGGDDRPPNGMRRDGVRW